MATVVSGLVSAQGEYVRTNPDGTVTVRDGAVEHTGWPVDASGPTNSRNAADVATSAPGGSRLAASAVLPRGASGGASATLLPDAGRLPSSVTNSAAVET